MKEKVMDNSIIIDYEMLPGTINPFVKLKFYKMYDCVCEVCNSREVFLNKRLNYTVCVSCNNWVLLNRDDEEKCKSIFKNKDFKISKGIIKELKKSSVIN